MFGRLKKSWQSISSHRPGERFRRRYFQLREQRQAARPLQRLRRLASGIGIVLLGILLLFLPGPGWLLICAGLALISTQSLVIARLLDRSELWLRFVLSRVRKSG